MRGRLCCAVLCSPPSGCAHALVWAWQAGCEDGCVKLFSIADGGLVYERSLEKQKGEDQPHTNSPVLNQGTGC